MALIKRKREEINLIKKFEFHCFINCNQNRKNIEENIL